MQRKAFTQMECPVARGLERVGEWWNILILRDAFYGLSRFDEFQTSLGIATNTLTRRLNALVAEDLLERRLYSEKPARYEYVLTPRGRDFRPVLLALLAWGNKHFADEGVAIGLVDVETGAPFRPVIVDEATGRPATKARAVLGPAASADLRRHFETMAAIRKDRASKPSRTGKERS